MSTERIAALVKSIEKHEYDKQMLDLSLKWKLTAKTHEEKKDTESVLRAEVKELEEMMQARFRKHYKENMKQIKQLEMPERLRQCVGKIDHFELGNYYCHSNTIPFHMRLKLVGTNGIVMFGWMSPYTMHEKQGEVIRCVKYTHSIYEALSLKYWLQVLCILEPEYDIDETIARTQQSVDEEIFRQQRMNAKKDEEQKEVADQPSVNKKRSRVSTKNVHFDDSNSPVQQQRKSPRFKKLKSCIVSQTS